MSDGAHILIVDDDADICEVIILVLRSEGYRADCARDGIEALDWLARHAAPQLILVDLRMPRMSGRDFVLAARGTPALAGIPIIVLSGDAGARAEAAEIATPYVAKPVDIDVLLAAVRGVLGNGPGVSIGA